MTRRAGPVLAVLTLLGALLGAVVLVVVARPAAACSCIASTDEELCARADFAFVGTVTHLTDPGPQPVGEVVATFVVSGVEKGPIVPAVHTVRTAANSAACGVTFEVGQEYRVLGFIRDGALTTNLCSGTRLASQVPATTSPPTTATTLPPARPTPATVVFTG